MNKIERNYLDTMSRNKSAGVQFLPSTLVLKVGPDGAVWKVMTRSLGFVPWRNGKHLTMMAFQPFVAKMDDSD